MRTHDPAGWLAPAVLALALAGPCLLASALAPIAHVTLGALGALVLTLAAMLHGVRATGRSAAIASVSAAALAVWLCIAALTSANPRVSFVGAIAQHNGAALWVLAASWFLGGILTSDRRGLRHLLLVVSVFGWISALLGILEAATSGARLWGSAAGPFENSSSLGQYLAVAALASASLALSSRSKPGRALNVAGALVCLLGMLAADSRAGVAGLLAGAFVAGVLYVGRNLTAQRRSLAFALPVVGIAATTALAASATAPASSALRRAVATVGTQRDAIWRSAAKQIWQSPVVGSGPEQFSAWVSWSFGGGALQFNATYDPHNALLGLALGGGVIALALWTAWSAATMYGGLAVLDDGGNRAAVALVLCLPVALMGSALFAWLTPAAVLSVAVISGALLCRNTGEARAEGLLLAVTRVTSLVLWGLCAVSLVFAATSLLAQVRFQKSTSKTAAEYVGLYRQWPDPAFASLAIDALLTSGEDPQGVLMQLGDMERQSSWHADLALREVFVAQRDAGTEDGWRRFEAAVERGAAADPASGIWYTLAAAQANASGMSAKRRTYASMALDRELSNEDREYVQGLLDKP